jgi:steroid 5-alpha reductase family enzyme
MPPLTVLPEIGWFAPSLGLAASFLGFTVLWVASLRTDDVGIIDFYWAAGFAVIGWIAYLSSPQAGAAALLMVIATTLWAVRLTAHLVHRHAGSEAEDRRYAAMRAGGGPNFKRNSLFMIFWLQALLQWLIAAPLHAGAGAGGAITPLFALGMGLFAAGFIVEAAADWQLMRFKADPRNRGRLLTSGLFSIVRHPNYTGEIVLWWGLGVAGFALSGAVVALIGPALLTLILLKVSGPTLQAPHLAQRPGYAAWAARTNAVFPWPRRARGRTVEPAE